MSLQPTPLPDGEIMMVSDRLMLVEGWDIASIAGFLLGREGTELAVHVTFKGRINKSDETADVTIALTPRGAYDLSGHLLDQIELLGKAEGTT